MTKEEEERKSVEELKKEELKLLRDIQNEEEIIKKHEQIIEAEEESIRREEKRIKKEEDLIEKKVESVDKKIDHMRRKLYDLIDWKKLIWEVCEFKKELTRDKEVDFVCQKTNMICRYEDCPRNQL